jgi:diguanylate cyclase (GGDEF)-like protein
VRLIRRSDTSLAVALIVGAFVVFQRPLRGLLDFVHEIEVAYHVDLLAGLTLLGVVFLFHQFRKWQQTKLEMQAVTIEAARVRARSEELEQLVILGHAVAGALDRAALQQVLWRALPEFVGRRECWILTASANRWDVFLKDDRTVGHQSLELLESAAARVAAEAHEPTVQNQGVLVSQDLCFPLVAGGECLGVIGVRNDPPLDAPTRRALSAAVATVAVAVRNVQLLHDMRETSERDGLTGCLNRDHGIRVLQTELRRARRTGHTPSVLMFDVDHFKTINDTRGHLRGDAVLAAIGARLKALLRSTDMRCRYGGDEFLVILPDTPSLGAQQVAEGLRRDMEQLRLGSGELAPVTLSIGVAAAIPGELDPTEMISRVDEALYRAKREGRNRFCLAAPKPPTGTAAAAAESTAAAG